MRTTLGRLLGLTALLSQPENDPLLQVPGVMTPRQKKVQNTNEETKRTKVCAKVEKELHGPAEHFRHQALAQPHAQEIGQNLYQAIPSIPSTLRA